MIIWKLCGFLHCEIPKNLSLPEETRTGGLVGTFLEWGGGVEASKIVDSCIVYKLISTLNWFCELFLRKNCYCTS